MQRMTWFSVLGFSALALVACSSSNGGSTTKGSGGSGASTSSTGGKSSSSTGGKSTSSTGGSGGSTTSATGGAGGSTTSATGGSATGGSATTGTGGSATGTGGSAANTVQLTVKDYLSWCSVTVGANAASSLGSQTVSVPENSTVSLSMTALTGFDLGDWHHTKGDTGNGDPGTVTNGVSKTSVDVTTGTKCVWVCCPTHGLPDDCPTTDQCP